MRQNRGFNTKKGFSKYERFSIIALFVLLCFILILKCAFNHWNEMKVYPIAKQDSVVEDFLKNLEVKEQKTQTKYNKKKYNKLFFFDPNKTDSITFRKLGLKSWQAKNAVKYVNRGGHWKSAEHFSKLYGFSHKEYLRLKPYIKIPKDTSHYSKCIKGTKDSVSAYSHVSSDSNGNRKRFTKFSKMHKVNDHKYIPYIKKYKEGTKLNLNSADTSALKHLPGIGSYYASKIVRYRNRLGGFVSKKQLKEVSGLPSDIGKWFNINETTNLHRLNINKSNFKELLQHPYLNYQQVKAIFEYRKRYGKVTSFDQLKLHPAFKSTNFELLKPYFIF